MNADYEAFLARQRWWDERAATVPRGRELDGRELPPKEVARRLSDIAAVVRKGGLRSERRALKEAKARCRLPHNKNYAAYGGRGIEVSSEWDGPEGIERFLEHIGPKPSDDYTLDRIDNDGNYEPGNVRWTSWTVQANNRRSSKLITWRGETLSAADWARRQGLTRQEIASRINLGWPVDLALLLGAQPEQACLLQAMAYWLRHPNARVSPHWRVRMAEAVESIAANDSRRAAS